MKKLIILAAIALLCVPTLSHAQLGRGELSVGYGFAPTTDWMKSYKKGLSDILGTHGANAKDKWGGVSLDYSFRVIGGLGVGASVIYSTNRMQANATAPGGNTLASAKTHYFALMPFVKMRWLNLKIVRLYSRVGIGYTYTHSKGQGISRDRSKLAWQVSPIGVEVGGKIAVFAEAGVGTAGSLIAGLRFTI